MINAIETSKHIFQSTPYWKISNIAWWITNKYDWRVSIRIRRGYPNWRIARIFLFTNDGQNSDGTSQYAQGTSQVQVLCYNCILGKWLSNTRVNVQ